MEERIEINIQQLEDMARYAGHTGEPLGVMDMLTKVPQRLKDYLTAYVEGCGFLYKSGGDATVDSVQEAFYDKKLQSGLAVDALMRTLKKPDRDPKKDASEFVQNLFTPQQKK